MADEVTTVAVKRPLWQRILKWIGLAILGLLVLVAVVLLGINTDPGHRFLADQIGNYKTASGLNIKVGRIDGSIYGRMTLRDLRVSDPKGVFVTSPRLDVDWRPFAFINNHVDVRSLESGLITMARNPELIPQPSDPNAPTLPDLDIDIARLKIDRFVMEPAVAGQRHIVRATGSSRIAARSSTSTPPRSAPRGWRAAIASSSSSTRCQTTTSSTSRRAWSRRRADWSPRWRGSRRR
jgi:translocation and assembly module TamB